MRVEISVAGNRVAEMSLAELRERSDDVKALGLLPSVADRETSGAGAGVADVFGERRLKIPVCGDGTCFQGGFFNEDCETCPQDCGGPCQICGNGFCGSLENCSTCAADCGACPTCPTNLGNETRTSILSTTVGGLSCLRDIYNFNSSSYYQATTFNYITFQVQRTRECDGSITETVVPGTTSYFSTYCYRYLNWPCSFGFIYPGCVV